MASRRVAEVSGLALFVLALAGCGGGDGDAESAAGAKVFETAGCGGCHAFAAAGSRGTLGPDLDQLDPSRDRVVRQVQVGGNGMPAYAGELADDEIEAVADFVAGSASSSDAARTVGFEQDRTTIEDCESRLEPTCYQQAFGNLAFVSGPDVALARFATEILENRTVEADCHRIAHKIGAAALVRYDEDVGRAFVDGTTACGSGYYHGLLEWKLAGVEEQQVASVARSVCFDDEIRSSAFTYYQCNHGLGHGLMLYTKYELPEALELCHRLQTDSDAVSCTGGVFMENQQSSYGIRSKWLKDDDLLYPCPTVAEADKLYCYLLVTSQILPKVAYDWKRTADWCRRSEASFVEICFQSYGRDASGTSRQEPAGIRERCREAGSGERSCVFGAVRDILNNDAADLRARQLCETIGVAYRAYCFFGLGSILGVVHGTESGRRTACATFAPAARDRAECLRGANTIPVDG